MAYCDWAAHDKLYRRYHDLEWGTPTHDDREQFEHLMMEAMQCGLSWGLMLKKREIFHACFDGFDFDKVAAYGPADVERILAYPGMIRSRPKVEAIINNARCFQAVRADHGSFSAWLWAHTGGKTILYNKHETGLIPASNGLSEKIAKELKAYGFKYLGPVTVYSHLQSSGVINDHDANCPCYARINATTPTVRKNRTKEKGVIQF